MKKMIKTLLCCGILLTLTSVPAYAGQWQIDNQGWWYQNDDNTYLANGWQWIDGKCYYFSPEGYCLINTTTPDGYTVDQTGAWTINGIVQTQQPEQTEANQSWVGTYVSDDGQTIAITSADDSGVLLSFMGYSEEGWYTETEVIPYRNAEKTQVSSTFYFDGKLIEETVYMITETGIQVEILPSGGWKEGSYIRQ